MKKRLLIIFLFLCFLCFTGCQNMLAAKSQNEKNISEVRSIVLLNPLGPLVIPASGITSEHIKADTEIIIQNWKTVDEVTGLMAAGNTPFVVLPITTAANLNANGIPLVLLGVHEWKVFYLIASQDTAFSDWDSLIGKTLYSPEGKGQTVDTLTRYALINAGVTPDVDVKFVYAPAQEIVALYKEGKVEYAALPEPFVSLAIAGEKGNIVMDYQKYWSEEKNATHGIPIAGLFVRRDFYENYPEITEDVVSTFSKSINWANENPEKAVEASSSILTIPENIMLSALERMKFEFIPAAKSKQDVLDFLNAMQKTYPEGIKAIPADSFFAE